jgi:peptidyl-prolyl isomerase D
MVYYSSHSHLVRKIENYPTSSGDAPTAPIVIATCGVLSHDDPSLADAAAADGDKYEDYPDDESSKDVQQPEIALEIATEIREIGNKLFKEGKPEAALEKYQSTSYFFCSN